MDISTGRPELTKEQIDDLFRKLEPRLKAGLSINKACLEAQVPKSTVYDLLHGNSMFAERVEVARNFHAILVTDIVTKELQRISQTAGTLPLSANDIP